MPAEATPTDLTICADNRPAPTPPSADNLRARLRSGTAVAHERLDSMIGLIDLRRSSDYRRFLVAHAKAVLPLEAALTAAGVQQLFPDWTQRRRAPALIEDINRLGGDVPLVMPLEPLGAATVLGTMYVLEGSRLGARVLLDIVRQSRDATVREATAYLSHGAGTRLWPTFLRVLESRGTALSDPAPAIEGARRAFALFEEAMKPLKAERGKAAHRPLEADMALASGRP